MEITFSIILLVLVLLFYLSNPRNKVNKWCAIAGFIFWLGIAKEAVIYGIIPALKHSAPNDLFISRFMPIYSVCTWALYSLAMPTVVIFALYFCDYDKKRPALLRFAKPALYIPAFFMSFFFPPLDFRAYQLGSLPFWATYSVYNLSLGALYLFLMIIGVRSEKQTVSKRQKRQVRIVVLPPVIFWATSVFLTHPFQINGLFKLWQVNAFILLFGIIAFIIMAFRDGFMGLRLSGETYEWNANMGIFGNGSEYTSHMLKNQTAKIDMCIEQLTYIFNNNGTESPEELAILSRSASTLKSYADKVKRHSQSIGAVSEPCLVADLLEEAISAALTPYEAVIVNIEIPEGISFLCDKNHMTEVFANILANAAEAMDGNGAIEINGSYSKSIKSFVLEIKDSGMGMDESVLDRIFTPYFSTKSPDKNFGLSLAYCKNVITRMDGNIYAKAHQAWGRRL